MSVEVIDPSRCPLCGGPNGCRMCATGGYKGPCWCETMRIPPELIERVPPELRNRACVCRKCVTDFLRGRFAAEGGARKLLPGDYYFENGLVVFTEQYHLRRGFCCGSGCRHCPWRELETEGAAAG